MTNDHAAATSCEHCPKEGGGCIVCTPSAAGGLTEDTVRAAFARARQTNSEADWERANSMMAEISPDPSTPYGWDHI